MAGYLQMKPSERIWRIAVTIILAPYVICFMAFAIAMRTIDSSRALRGLGEDLERVSNWVGGFPLLVKIGEVIGQMATWAACLILSLAVIYGAISLFF